MTIPIELVTFCGGALAGMVGLVALMWALVAWQRSRR